MRPYCRSPLPGTLQASLMARLDRLPAGKQVARIGAVIGREFSHAVLAAAASLSEMQLAQGLNELIGVRPRLATWRSPEAVYTFNHALTRDVAYASLLRGRRKSATGASRRPGEYDSGSVRATEPELLAYHFQEAEVSSAALTLLDRAGDNAEKHGANQEAVSHYRSAKHLTERADLSTADRARVPEILMKLGNAQTQMAGYYSEEAMRSYQEAHDVALAWISRTRLRRPRCVWHRSCSGVVAIAMSSKPATRS